MMKLKLQENPREWAKFVTVIAVLVVGLAYLARRRGWLTVDGWWIAAGAVAGMVIVAWIFPRAFRGFYRVGMTISFHVGQIMGRVLLTLLFFVVITPLGWCLRLAGKDLLELKRPHQRPTFWHRSRPPGAFDRQF